MREIEIGRVINYYSKISVAAILLTDNTISVGDNLIIYGYYKEVETCINYMEINHKSVAKAKKGESVGFCVPERVRKGEVVCKVVPE
jgi:putative protease